MIFQTLATKDYDSDSGIGLALVKKIVQEQGGAIPCGLRLALAYVGGSDFAK